MAETSSATAAPSGTPDITLYWLNQSRAQRILWLLEELNLPYKLVTEQREPTKFAPESATAVHPLGKYPMLKLNGRMLAESALIAETLIERYGPQLQPDQSDEDEWLRYRYFMHYAEGSLMPPMIVAVVMNSIRDAPVPFFVKPVVRMIVSKTEMVFLHPQMQRHFDFLEGELKDREFLAGGKLTGADIMLSFPLLEARQRMFSKEKYPNLWAYTERLQQMESFKKAAKLTADKEGQKMF